MLQFCFVILRLLGESASHSVMFFFHNKSANGTFCYDLSVKRVYIGHGFES